MELPGSVGFQHHKRWAIALARTCGSFGRVRRLRILHRHVMLAAATVAFGWLGLLVLQQHHEPSAEARQSAAAQPWPRQCREHQVNAQANAKHWINSITDGRIKLGTSSLYSLSFLLSGMVGQKINPSLYFYPHSGACTLRSPYRPPLIVLVFLMPSAPLLAIMTLPH
jgi:hypothetical protein